MAEPVPIGYLANVALGIALGVLAAAVARGYRRGPGRLLLTTYLGLVGANYVLDGLRMLAWDAGLMGLGDALGVAAVDASALDPPFLLLFAAHEAGMRVRGWVVAASLALPVGFVLSISEPTVGAGLRWVYFAVLVACYAGAFVLLARARLRADEPAQRGRLDALLLAFGPVTLGRLPLTYVDLGLVGGLVGRAAPRTLVMDAGLLLLFAAAAAGILLADRRRASRSGMDALLVPLGALLAVVALAWALRFVPALQAAAFAFLYSVRWFLLLAVLVRASHREALLEARPAAGRALPAVFALLLVATAVSVSSALVATLSEESLPETFLSGLAIVGSAMVVLAAVRLALPGPRDELASRRVSLYRAQVDLGAGREELERLRRELGLTQRAAREVEALAALERRLPRAAAGLDTGRLFLGRYRVEGVVGVGTFGRAWAAEDTAEGGRVVLKELREEWRQDPRALRRFVAEIRSAMRIRHPNLVAFRALERDAGGFVLVLEHVEGQTLRARLAQGTLPETEAARLAHDLARGLAALHRAGIVHRDVKPENVVLRPDGTAVLLDLGASADAVQGGTVPDAPLGTPAYMSPEAKRGEPGPSSDVYALGVVLWETMAGRPPPWGEVPPAWRGFLLCALDPDPALRFADAAEAERALPGAGGAVARERAG